MIHLHEKKKKRKRKNTKKNKRQDVIFFPWSHRSRRRWIIVLSFHHPFILSWVLWQQYQAFLWPFPRWSITQQRWILTGAKWGNPPLALTNVSNSFTQNLPHIIFPEWHVHIFPPFLLPWIKEGFVKTVEKKNIKFVTNCFLSFIIYRRKMT